MADLNKNQRRALAALLAETTIRDAAKAAGLGETTLYRYLRDPDFRAELQARQSELIAAAVASLAGLTGDAVGTLRAAMADPNATTSAKVRAASLILDHVQKLTTFAELETRLAALEARLA